MIVWVSLPWLLKYWQSINHSICGPSEVIDLLNFSMSGQQHWTHRIWFCSPHPANWTATTPDQVGAGLLSHNSQMTGLISNNCLQHCASMYTLGMFVMSLQRVSGQSPQFFIAQYMWIFMLFPNKCMQNVHYKTNKWCHSHLSTSSGNHVIPLSLTQSFMSLVSSFATFSVPTCMNNRGVASRKQVRGPQHS